MSFDLPIAWVVVVGVAVACVAAYARGRPEITLGLLFAAASFSGLTAPTPLGSVRLEQGALVAMAAILLVRRPGSIVALVRAAPWVALFGLLYLGASVASSILLAAEPAESLKITAWLALSMLGLVIAAVLVRDAGSDLQLPRWIVGAAAIQVLVGLAAVLSQAFLGTEWGVQTGDVILGKTNGLSWEANILAINLAMALAFVVVPDGLPGVSPRVRIAALLWLALGLGLAYSRGGLVALGVAVGTMALGLAWLGRRHFGQILRLKLAPLGALGALSLVIALGTIQTQSTLGRMGVGITPGTVITDGDDTDDIPIPTARPADPGDPEPSASPEIRYVGTGDTLALRLRNIRIGIDEMMRSPLIGLGTDSYRQRHIEPSCRCPAHIANLPAAALYDAGIIGIVGLGGLILTALWATWRMRAWGYLGALVVLIIGYQVTDAFRFASNWVFLGTIIGLWTVTYHRRTSA
jgi:hypothetical protein